MHPNPIHRAAVLALSLLLPLALPAQAQGGAKDGPKADKVDFKKQILPILEQNCFKCHRSAHTENGKTKKPKGGVIFDSKDGITKSKKGKVVVAKKPGDSLMIAAISLPADDEDRMPPAKEGDPLPKEKIELLTKWIEQGAEFGDWTGAAKEKGKGDEPKGDGKGDGGKKEGGGDDEAELEALADGLEPLDAAKLDALRAAHAQVESLGDESPLLHVSFLGHEDATTDQALAALLPAKDHVAELVLARTAITDGAGALLAQMPRLRHLDLRETTIGDDGVRALAALKELRSLNLFGTKAGDAGVGALAACTKLRQLYVWQTPVSAAAVVALQKDLPEARIVFAADLPEPMAEGAAGARGRRGR
jgi:hypothetical protein